jgi:hypothetical protein
MGRQHLPQSGSKEVLEEELGERNHVYRLARFSAWCVLRQRP